MSMTLGLSAAPDPATKVTTRITAAMPVNRRAGERGDRSGLAEGEAITGRSPTLLMAHP